MKRIGPLTLIHLRRRAILVIGLIGLLAGPGSKAYGQKSPVIADGAQLTLVSDRFSFTEGPATDAAGTVYFTDQPDNAIWKYGVDGRLTLFMRPAGRSNGMYFDADGNLIACADQRGEIWSIRSDKTVNVLVSDYRGKRLNGPNDLWIDPKGGIYFTDPFYLRDYWERTEKEIEQERVYYLTPDRNHTIAVADELVKPNGIIGSPDGEMLYIADIGASKTYSYTVGKGGRLSGRQLFVEMGSDGMTIDNEGNIYLTGDGVTVFNKEGNRIDHIPVPRSWTANVTFGGPGRKTLFITASSAVYTLKMNVEGR